MTDEIDLDTLQHVSAGANTNGHRTLAIRPSRDGYITSAADESYFSHVDHVAVYISHDDDALAFEPVPAEDLDNYHDLDILRLTREGQTGASVSLKSAFQALGVGKGDLPIETTRHVELKRQDGFLVATVGDLLPDDRDDGVANTDGGAPTAAGESIPSSVDPDAPATQTDGGAVQAASDDPDLAAARRVAQAHDDLQDFADALGEPVGIARGLAMDAGVYSDLHDRPDAYRGGVRQ